MFFCMPSSRANGTSLRPACTRTGCATTTPQQGDPTGEFIPALIAGAAAGVAIGFLIDMT